jgi:lipopolysaccharide/colanic/teichoic acid biosynthesis glycosyltransferase
MMLSRASQLGIKRALDFVGAATALVALSSVMSAAAIAVRATMGSPVLFRQRRPGYRGRPFELLKFRTMRAAGPGEGVESDGARLTRFGKFLRESSIDELPSLINVLRGEMSLVGPRPLLMEYLDRYSAEQARRHDMRPGLTGWAQVNGRNSKEWDEKLGYDSWYVDHWSLWLDLKILARTPSAVLRREGISFPGRATSVPFEGARRTA